MLEVQKFLQAGHSLAELEKQVGVKATFHPTDNRVILNYDQINSPKLHPIIRETRGLVLDKTRWNIVARAFPRFFNLGEVPEEDKLFVWEDSIATYKEDGSLILVYFYNGQWHVNTRGSFGSMPVNGLDFTWRDLFFSALGDAAKVERMRRGCTYVFELCSPYTQVVRRYAKPKVYLLSVFDNVDGEESFEYTLAEAELLNVEVPPAFKFGESTQAADHIAHIAKTDKTFEGVVLRDVNDRRIKMKSASYVEIHRLSNNGNVAIPRNIAKIILDNEQDEILAYFPALKNDFDKVKAKIDKMVNDMDNLWYCFHDEKSPRKFAEAVGKCKLAKLLFDAKKRGVNPKQLLTEEEFKAILIRIIDNEYKIKLKGQI